MKCDAAQRLTPAHRFTPARRLTPAILCLLACMLGWVEISSAAFEWEHPTPQSLIAGDSPARWPVAGAGTGFRADAIAARPWGWHEVGAAAIRIAGAGRQWAAGVAISQLRAPAYRESRLAVGVEQSVSGQRFGLNGSFLGVTVGGDEELRSTSGIEGDLGWSLDLKGVRVAARAESVLRTPGAQGLVPPRRLRLRLDAGGPLVRSEIALEEGSRGRRLGIGISSRPFKNFRMGAAWSSAEPPVRLLVSVSRGALALSAGWAWHSTLPATRLLSLGHGALEAPSSAP